MAELNRPYRSTLIAAAFVVAAVLSGDVVAASAWAPERAGLVVAQAAEALPGMLSEGAEICVDGRLCVRICGFKESEMGERTSPAVSRYRKRFTATMILYALLLMGSVWILKNAPPAEGPLRYILALAPSLPLLGTIWAMGAYLYEEPDEFKRAILAQSMLWGLGLTLAFTTTWGFLEEFAGVARFPLYLVFPVFCGAMGVSSFFARRRYQ